jgi:hypothetical protein
VAFAAFCTYRRVSGHFAMGFGVGLEGRLVDRVDRREFAERFAATVPGLPEVRVSEDL